MSTPSSLLRSLLSNAVRASLFVALVAALALTCLSPRSAAAQEDPRASARIHYQAGQKAYAAGDYRLAIREFASAEQLAPSGYNDYNLGLCYDKIGEADPAVRYYRSYLDRVPDAKNRAAVEASISRLDAAMSSAQTKEQAKEQARLEAERRAEEQRRLEAAKRAEEEKRAIVEAEAAKLAAAEVEAKRATEAAKRAQDLAGAEGAEAPSDGTGDDPKGSTIPGTTATGDPQIDRASAIDLAAIRTERAPLMGGNGQAQGDQAPRGNNSSPSATPIYKKWWFWALIGLGGVIIVSNLADSSDDGGDVRIQRSFTLGAEPGSNAGATLLRW